MVEPKKAEVEQTGTFQGEVFIVKEACDGSEGKWVCLSHDMEFRNNIAKDIHLSGKKISCVFAWLCPEHGVEVP